MTHSLLATVMVMVLSAGVLAQQPKAKEPQTLSEEEVTAAWNAVKQHGCVFVGYLADTGATREIAQDIDKVKRGGFTSTYYGMAYGRSFILGFPDRTTDVDLARLSLSLKRLPGLRALDLGSCRISDVGMKSLKDLVELDALYLDRTGVGDAGIKELAQLQRLRWLDLSHAKLTDKGAADLAALANLQFLSLAGNSKITDESWQALVSLRMLRKLDLSDTAVSLATTVNFSDWKNLRRLRLARTPLDETGLKVLNVLPALEALDLSGTPISGAGLAALNKLDKLEELCLAQANITDEGTKALPALKQLRKLDLGNAPIPATPPKEPKEPNPSVKITDAAYTELAKCTELRKLRLAHLSIGGEGIRELAKLEELVELDLEGTAVKAVALLEIREIKNLRSLNLARTPLSGNGVRSLGDLPYLQALSLAGSKLNDAGLADLGWLKGLRELDLRDTTVSSAGVAHLTATQLVKLDLSRTKVDATAVKSLGGIKNLRVLDVQETGLVYALPQLKKALPNCGINSQPPKKPTTPDYSPRLPVE